MITILENQKQVRFLVLDQAFDIEESLDFNGDMFDAIFLMTEDENKVRVILKEMNPVISNKCSYKPLFCQKKVEGKLALFASLVDGYFDDIEDQQLADIYDKICANRAEFGIKEEFEPITNTNMIFVRMFRYMMTRGKKDDKPVLIEGSSVGYVIPLIELFYSFGKFHLMELFTFEQIMLEHGYFRVERFLNKIYLCPNCHHSHMLYVENCPKCGSSEIQSEEVIHHFRCANVSPEHTYNFGGQLRCPKCKKVLRHIGIDYDRPATVFSCKNCDHSFLNPDTKAICTNCGEEHSVGVLMPHDIMQCSLTPEGLKALSSPNIGFAVYTDFYDNYLDYSRFISRVRLLIAERESSELLEDMTVGKIWIYNENDITVPFAGDLVADFCRSFSNHKVSVANNIIYVSDSVLKDQALFAIDSFRVEISEAIHRAVRFLHPGQRLCYSVALLDDDIQTVNQYIQKLMFVEANPDESYSYDDWIKQQGEYQTEFTDNVVQPEESKSGEFSANAIIGSVTSLEDQFDVSNFGGEEKRWYNRDWTGITGWIIAILLFLVIIIIGVFLIPHTAVGLLDLIEGILPSKKY